LLKSNCKGGAGEKKNSWFFITKVEFIDCEEGLQKFVTKWRGNQAGELEGRKGTL